MLQLLTLGDRSAFLGHLGDHDAVFAVVGGLEDDHGVEVSSAVIVIGDLVAGGRRRGHAPEHLLAVGRGREHVGRERAGQADQKFHLASVLMERARTHHVLRAPRMPTLAASSKARLLVVVSTGEVRAALEWGLVAEFNWIRSLRWTTRASRCEAYCWPCRV